MTNRLEYLPNEIFSYIFCRLSFINIYCSFFNLNNRFSALVIHFTQRKNFAIDGYLTRFQIDFAIKHILPLINNNQLQKLELRHNDLFRNFLRLDNFSPSFVSVLTLVSLNNVPFSLVYGLLIRCSGVQAVIIDVTSDGIDTEWLNGSLWDELVDSRCLRIRSLRVSVGRIYKDRSISTTDITSSFRSSVWIQRRLIITCLDRQNTYELTIHTEQQSTSFAHRTRTYLFFREPRQ
jgi:hypothetical protein